MANADGSKIVYRRIRGRIIPIRQKGQELPKEVARPMLKRGIAATASGLAVAGAAGVAQRKARQLTFRFRTAAMDIGLGRFGFGGGAEGAGAGVHLFKSAKRIQKLLPGIRKAGRLGGAALVGLGTSKIIESTGVEQRFGLPASIVNEAAGTLASIATYAAFSGAGGVKKAAGRAVQTAITKSKTYLVSAGARRYAKIGASLLLQKLTGFKLKP